MKFPQFRKGIKEKEFYKIFSTEEFDEIKLIGKKVICTKVMAYQYPERLYIKDLLNLHGNYWKEASQIEYDNMLSMVTKPLPKE